MNLLKNAKRTNTLNKILMNIVLIILIFFFHWVGDFVLQSNWMATQKATNLFALMTHVLEYSTMWLILTILYIMVATAFLFAPASYIVGAPLLIFFITFISHFAIDFVTSKVNRKLSAIGKREDNYHNLFVSIGFDQFLHLSQLIITFYLIL